ncbi:MAG: methyl-accepting chemotaxis protein, partial [Hydrogenovibrio sp.]|nr:methyl-accepting chemotaxis protein [Hydrogenovibrio sp.]
GEFDVRAPVEGKDEIAEMSKAFNSLLQNLQLAINEANSVVGAIAEGRFDERIQADLKGDLQVLKSGVNGSAESVEFMMAELGKVMDALYHGDFSSKMDERVAGEFRSKTESALSAMSGTVSGIIAVMEKMQEGKFQHRVQVEARGDLLTLKEGVNNSMDALESAMQDITRVVVAQSDGDLTQSITNEYQGALRVLKDAVNASAKKLNQTVAEILGVSESVASASYEVSDGSNNLSRRTQEMAASLEETAASMEEMTSTVKQNTDFANQASQLATQARNQAGDGGKIAAQAVEAMRTITDTSYKISDIITLIDGIAFQTNLLALNAAVEAARAGDHGRGFAVVAGEVRSLAQKSAEASRDIKELIESSVANVEAGSKYVEETGASLESINGAIQKVSDIVAEIATASSEQATGIDQVNKAIMSLDEVTQQNAALGEETSAAADSLNDQSASLKELMSFFTSDAQGQKQLVTQAKIEAAAKETKADKGRDGQDESWSEF